MPDDISILDLVDESGFEASLITTFNACLPFYEEIILRRLRANGCRHNVVIMDRTQCEIAWASEAMRPRQAGYDYSLIPISVEGAFHPKIALFVGQKKLRLLVGSHNLTISGVSHNRELSNMLSFVGKETTDSKWIVSEVWRVIESWVSSSRSYCPDSLVEDMLSIKKKLKPFLADQDAPVRSPFILAQSSSGKSLFDQLIEAVSFPVSRGIVIGPFFDEKLLFLKELLSNWPSAIFTVGIDPESVFLASGLTNPRLRFVDVRCAWTEYSSRYLHAKALYLESNNGDAFFASGSANPSAPAWGLSSVSRNAEAIRVLYGEEARGAISRTKIDELFSFPSIEDGILADTHARSTAIKRIPGPALLPIWNAIADDQNRTVVVRMPTMTPLVHIVPCDERNETLMLDSEIINGVSDVKIKFAEDTTAIRSILATDSIGKSARIIVHHSAVIASHRTSPKQHQIRVALGQLGEGGANISALINRISDVIFSEESTKYAAKLAPKGSLDGGEKEHTRPETLSIDLTEPTKQSRKRKLIEGGDLGYLLDLLIRRLHIPSVSVSTTLPDASGGTPETGDDPEPEFDPTPDFDDHAIADAVFRKTRTLVKKMVNKEERAFEDINRMPETLAQLIAVISMLKEIKHLETQPKWQEKNLKLVDNGALKDLLQKSMYYLHSSEVGIWRVATREDLDFEELDTLKVLLGWLTWEIGYDFSDKIPKSWEIDKLERNFKLSGNAYIAKLLPQLIKDDLVDDLTKAMHSTVEVSPVSKALADSWLQRNVANGQRFLKATEIDARPTISAGDFAYVPWKMEDWAIVLDADEHIVRLWDFKVDSKELVPWGFTRENVLECL